MKIEFKAITPKKGALEKQAREALKRQVTERLRKRLQSVECPDHHEGPQVIVSGFLRDPKFRIEGCCQKLIDLATEALK